MSEEKITTLINVVDELREVLDRINKGVDLDGIERYVKNRVEQTEDHIDNLIELGKIDD